MRVRRDDHADDRDDAQVGNAEDLAVAELVERVGQAGGVDLVAARPARVEAADDVQRAERDDEARHAAERDDRAVDDPAGEPDARAGEDHEGERHVRVVDVDRARRRRPRARGSSRSRGRRCASRSRASRRSRAARRWPRPRAAAAGSSRSGSGCCRSTCRRRRSASASTMPSSRKRTTSSAMWCARARGAPASAASMPLTPPPRSATPAAARMIETSSASLRGELAGDTALEEHDHAIGHAEHLGQLARDHEDRDALVGEIGEQAVHLGLGADVDAARRLVDDQQRRPAGEPLGQHDLLLVAARERPGRIAQAPVAQLQARRPLAREAPLG